MSKKRKFRKKSCFQEWECYTIVIKLGLGDTMAKRKKSKKSIRRILFLGIISLTIIVGTTYTIGKYWVEIYGKYKEKKELKHKLTTLKEKEEELQVDADKLQNPDYIARYAREKYSYSKDGEIILRIP